MGQIRRKARPKRATKASSGKRKAAPPTAAAAGGESPVAALDAIGRIASHFDVRLDLDRLLKEIADGITKATDFDAAVVNIYNERDELEVRASQGIPPSVAKRLTRERIPRKRIETLLKKAKTISRSHFISHTSRPWEKFPASWSYAPKMKRLKGPAAWHPDDALIIPLGIAGRGTIGFVSVDKPRSGKIPDRGEVALLELFAAQAAIAVENATLYHQVERANEKLVQGRNVLKQLYEEAERKAQELGTLTRIGQVLSSSLNPDVLLETIYRQMGLLMDTSNMYIALYNEREKWLEFPLYYEGGRRIKREGRTLQKGLTEYVIRTRKPLLVRKDFERETKKLGIHYFRSPAKCYLGVPMTTEGRVVGVIAINNFERDEAYDEGHVEMVSTFAAQAAVALRNAELYQEILESRNDYATVVDTASRAGQGIAMLKDEGGEEGIYWFVNDEFCRITGYTREELMGMNYKSLVAPEEFDRVDSIYKKRERGETVPRTYETVLKKKDGTRVPVEVSATVSSGTGSAATIAFVRDITERKRAVEGLRKSEASLAQAQGIAHLGNWEWDIASGVVAWSDEMYRIYGYGEPGFPVTFEKAMERVEPADAARVRADLERSFAAFRPPEMDFPGTEYTIVLPSGERRVLFGTGKLVSDERGRPARMFGTVQDVTQRKRAEDELRHTVSLVGATLESTADGILVVDAGGRITSFNRRFVEMWRIPDEIVASRDDNRALGFVLDQLSDPEGFLAKVKDLYAAPEAESFDVLRFKDGRVFERYSLPQRIGGTSVGRVWSFRDVTKRVHAEEKVRASRASLAEAQRLAHIGSWEWDVAADVVTWSDELFRIYGLKPQSIPLSYDAFLERVHPEDRATVKAAVERAYRSASAFTFDHRIVRPDGTHRWLNAHGQVAVDGSGRAVRMTGTGQDITERRLAEERLRASEEKLRSIVDNVPDTIMTLDRAGRILYVNRPLPSTTVAGGLGARIHEHMRPEYGETLDTVLSEVFEKKETVHFEVAGADVDGGMVWYDSRMGPVVIGGKVDSAILVSLDVTERKRAEAEIMALSNLNREIVENAPIGILYMDTEGRITYENPHLLEIMGHAGEGPPLNWNERITDLPTVKAVPPLREKILRLLKGEPFWGLETDYVSLYAKTLTMSVSGVPLRQADGSLKGGLLLVSDVTDRVRLQRQLESHARELETRVEERTSELVHANRRLSEAKANIETIYNATIDGLVMIDKDLKIVSMNHRTGQIFGMDVDWALEADVSEVRKVVRSRYKTPALFDEDLKVYDRPELVLDNEIELAEPAQSWVHQHSEAIYDENGHYLGRVWTYRDITEAKKARQDLLAAQEKYKAVVETAVEGIVSADNQGMITYANSGTARMFGYAPEELVGKPLTVLMPARYHDPHRRGLRRFLETGEKHVIGRTVELTGARKEGGEFPVELSIAEWKAGGHTNFTGIIRDVTHRKRLEEELKRYTTDLEIEVERRTLELVQSAKMAALGQLVAGVAHEINNPLAFVKSNTQSVRDVLHDLTESAFLRGVEEGAVSPEDVASFRSSPEYEFLKKDLERLLEQNVKGLDRISQIVFNLKHFASPQQGRQELSDVNTLLKDTLAIFHPQFKDRVTVVETYGELPQTRLDAGQVNQVFMNVLVNAAQAIPGQGTVTVRTRSSGAFVEIAISDTGVGIPEGDRKKIFDPFFTTKQRGNTGLGLSICYQIIKEHGGDILVDSEVGKGTTFTIKLPVRT